MPYGPSDLREVFCPTLPTVFICCGEIEAGRCFRLEWPDTFSPILMAVLWMGAFAFYGMSSTYLGSFGTSIGWGLFQIFMIMTAILSGVWAGEWKSAPRRSMAAAGNGLRMFDRSHCTARNGESLNFGVIFNGDASSVRQCLWLR